MTVLEQLGAYVAHGGRASLSDSVRQAVRLHLTDTVGAWIAGSSTPEGWALAGLGSPPRERAGLKSTGAGALDRVMTNCALARLSEIDDIHLSSATTPGALIVPAALTIGGSLALDRTAIAEAIVVGYEAMVRRCAQGAGDPLPGHLADLFHGAVWCRCGCGAASRAHRPAGGARARYRAHPGFPWRRPPERRSHVALARTRARGP